jgi:hypothetical protein
LSSLEATSFRAIRSSRAVMSEVWLAVTSHTSLDVICQQANEASWSGASSRCSVLLP